MADAPEDVEEDSGVCDFMQDDDAYQQLLDSFIDAAVDRAATGQGDPDFAAGYRDAVTRLVTANRAVVDAFQHVSIEKILLRALVLGALKWDPTGLVVEPFARDPVADADAHGDWYAEWRENGQRAVARVGSRPRAASPERSAAADEAGFVALLDFRRRYFGTDRTVHLGLAPPFADVVTADPPLRCDLWFWSPADPAFGVIVECAGFQPHRRDRSAALVPPPDGVSGRRFAGIDIFRDPIAVCGEILGGLHAARGEAAAGAELSHQGG